MLKKKKKGDREGLESGTFSSKAHCYRKEKKNQARFEQGSPPQNDIKKITERDSNQEPLSL